MRVLSLLASGTEIVCALGAGDTLVGRSHECDNPPWVRTFPACTRPAFDVSMSSGEIDAEVRRRLHLQEPLYHVDADRIRHLHPDLLITQMHCEVCAVTPDDVDIVGCGFLASQVLALCAGTVEGIFDGVRSIARSMNLQSEGEDLIATMRSRNLLALHPTVKPVALVADAIKDSTTRGDLILDPFLGSGTTVIASCAPICQQPVHRRSRPHLPLLTPGTLSRTRSPTQAELSRISGLR
jgi:iron complex transport system substrate-binding protein